MNDRIENKNSISHEVDTKTYNQNMLNQIFSNSSKLDSNTNPQQVLVSSSGMKQVYTSQNLNKRPQSRVKHSKPQEFQGRDEKVDSDIFYKIKDENAQLKKIVQNQNNDIKKLNAGFEKVKHNIIVERRLADRKVIPLDNGLDMELETLKNENAKLLEKTKKMTTIIQGLQQTSKSNNNLGRKNLISAKHNIDKQNETNEYLATINFLRQQLKDSQSEITRLHAELYGGGNSNTSKVLKNMGEYTKDLRDKSDKLAEISTKYEKTQMQFETNIKILEHTKQSLDEYISRYNEEKRKNLDLENRLQLMEVNLVKLPEYVKLIDEYKEKERHLESTIRDLCENPFIKEAEQRGNIYKKAQENELNLNEANRRLKNLEENNRALEKENKTLKEQLMVTNSDKERFKEDAMRYKISNEEREKYSKEFDEQIKLMGQYGEVDSNLTKILNVLKLKDDNNSWMKIDFLDKINSGDTADPVVLAREVERMKIEKGVLGSELEKTKSLLQIQQQINEDQQKVFEEDKKIYKLQIDKLMKKCEELSKLVDIERLPKEYARYKNHHNARELLIAELLPEGLHNPLLVSDAITEFSKDDNETDFGLNENYLDIYLGEAIFEEGLDKELGFRVANIMSFCSIDFYLHEPQLSNLCSGSKPIYNLQISFKINIDDNFLNYLECDYILVDIYYVIDNIQTIFGKGKIPLSSLIEQENPNTGINTRVVNNVCTVYYARDASIMIGSIHYKMRMRKPILELIKWHKEKNQIIREISPVHDIMMKQVEKDLLNVNNYSKGKVMAVTILLTKAIGLKTSGPPRKLMPYIYYQFYKFDEHFTKSAFGQDPLFQDVKKYECVYDNAFHEYVMYQNLEILIMDDSRQLEVEMMNSQRNTNTVNLLDSPEYDDLIGIAKIPLKDLIINNLIQNNFPIYNQSGQFAGEIVVNVLWEQIAIDSDDNSNNRLPYEVKAWEENLVIQLANLMKHKGLNLNSAFEIFDRENKQLVSLVNFRDTILFTFNFTSKQEELENLTQLIFNGKTNLSKLDFYKIFAYLLPNDGNITDNLISTPNAARNTINNQVVEDIKITIVPELNNNPNAGITQPGNNPNISSSQIERSQISFRKETNTDFKRDLKNQPNPIVDSNRTIKEIIYCINEYMIRTRKKQIVEVYKMFDKDANSFLDRHELAQGFARLGIPLSHVELEKIWKDVISETDLRTEKIDYSLFKRFYEKNTGK